MKKIVLIATIVGILLASCHHQPKSYYKTKEGRKKQKYYNELQFGGGRQ